MAEPLMSLGAEQHGELTAQPPGRAESSSFDSDASCNSLVRSEEPGELHTEQIHLDGLSIYNHRI
jgi:hypothetical protein